MAIEALEASKSVGTHSFVIFFFRVTSSILLLHLENSTSTLCLCRFHTNSCTDTYDTSSFWIIVLRKFDNR